MAQPTTRSAPPSGHTANVAQTRAALRDLRPDLVRRYDAEVPGARAAVLARLLGALDREPLPGVSHGAGRGSMDTEQSVTSDGRVITFPAAAARPFATASAGLTATATARREAGNPRAQGQPDTNNPRAQGQPEANDRRSPGRPETDNPETFDDPGALARTLWPTATLAAEIDNSVANLALARAANPAKPDSPDATDPEQSVIDGHPLHPCCRTRSGMTVADVLAYAPEHHPVFHLRRLRVPADRWHGTTEPILYAHPWQAERLRDTYPWLTDDGPTGPVRPLMSLRTVAPLDGGDHIKTAVDVQMTSAVRTVSPAAVHNGPRLSALLQELTVDLPLTCLAETGAGAVIVDGEPSRHLAYLRREAPRVGPGEVVLPLGATALISAAARTDPYGWFADLSAILWGPLVTVLDRGVALEAHGQNTLVVLRDGRPVRILYRDLGGVRVSPRRLRAAGVDPPDLLGDLPSDDPAVLRTKLAASALATVATELITTLTRDHGTDPARLWHKVAAGMPKMTGPLPIKATTAMRLAADPLTDIWATIENPLAAYA